jgi:short chain dehydrogenase
MAAMRPMMTHAAHGCDRSPSAYWFRHGAEDPQRGGGCAGQEAARNMLARGAGAIVVIGNTSAWRGVANYAGFAPSKAAQRILTQSMARSLGPHEVHVAYVVVDAVIDVPWAR